MKKIVFILLFCLWSAPCWACECVEESFGRKASRDNIERAKYIFEGKILGIENPSEASENPWLHKVTFEIIEQYKGNNDGPDIVAYDSMSSCSELPEHQSVFLLYEERYQDDDHDLTYLVPGGTCSIYIAPEHLEALKRGDYYHAD